MDSEVKHFPKVDHTPANLDEESRLLLRAAEVIEHRGWCQNEYTTSDGRLCVLGAVKTARGLSPRDDEDADDLVEKACERLYNAVGNRVHLWNDRPGRTQDEVVAKLRAVALGL